MVVCFGVTGSRALLILARSFARSSSRESFFPLSLIAGGIVFSEVGHIFFTTETQSGAYPYVESSVSVVM